MVMTNIATAIEHGHSAIQFVELPLLTMVDLSILFCKRLPEDTQCHKHREKPNLGMESPSKMLGDGRLPPHNLSGSL
jgi:hypothetical protein